MEGKDTPLLETTEQLRQQLLEFIYKTRFGDPQFQAISDYLDLRSLHNLREYDIDQPVKDTLKQIKKESDIRINEMKIALLELQVEQNKSRLSGYAHSYQHIQKALEDIYSLAQTEAENKFSDISAQEKHAISIRQAAYEDANEIISMKRDAS